VRSYWIGVRDGRAEGDLTCEQGHRVRLPDGSLDGVYAGWRWTGRELILDHDRYGFFPLFEWRAAGARVVSTDLFTLLEHGAPADLDLDALAVFVRAGFFVGADTPFRAIRAVAPPIAPARPLDITRQAAVDGFIDLFRTAIKRRLPRASVVIPLSGGRDSRHILLELRAAGHAPAACVTVRHFPPRANDDEVVARELCETLGIEHRVLDQPRNRAGLERRKNGLTHLCTDEHAHFVVLADHLRAHTQETYDGIAGDVLSQSGYLRPEVHERFARGDLHGVAEYVLSGYDTMMSEAALATVLARPIGAALSRERALARLLTEVAAHAGAPNPTASFFFANRTRREIALAPYGLMRDLTVYAPYLDRDLSDFLRALPATLVMDRALHTDAIARAWPQLARIPYERKGMKTPDRGAARAFAAELAVAVGRDGLRGWVRRATVLPGLLATCLDGESARLWRAPLLMYLDQIGKVAAATAARPRER
jgi:hypothetical protein